MAIKSPAHPGEVLKEQYLDKQQITQAGLAEKIGCHIQKINVVVNARRGISADFAMDLAKALNTTPEFWLEMQMKYDLWEAAKKRSKKSIKK